MQNETIGFQFFKSTFFPKNFLHSFSEIFDWIHGQRKKIRVDIKKIPLEELKHWSFDKFFSRFLHGSGKFFSIEGIQVQSNFGKINEWYQPIINQPEVGFLGFIVKEFQGTLYFLTQAKIEPGNINYVQLSPTLQATKSNYTQVHKGNKPAYLDYFFKVKPSHVLLDQFQSEQGARFLRKRNRNIIIKIDENIEVLDNFIWLTLGQLQTLMSFDNLVNMDTRTVLSGINFGSIENITLENYSKEISQSDLESDFLFSTLGSNAPYHTFTEITHFITKNKYSYELEIKRCPLSELKDWSLHDGIIQHKEKKYFSVIGTRVKIENREVTCWDQPMVKPTEKGLCAFITKKIKNSFHFLMQAKVEAGNFDIVELAPTVQCLSGNYTNDELPFLNYVLKAPKELILMDTMQSEEGGRFFREENRNMLILADDSISLEEPNNYMWMTLEQIKHLIQFSNHVNIQARSLIAALPFARREFRDFNKKN
jgi:oxidase EvaA